jgi:hypothetical protein
MSTTNPLGRRRSRPARLRHALVLALLAATSLGEMDAFERQGEDFGVTVERAG